MQIKMMSNKIQPLIIYYPSNKAYINSDDKVTLDNSEVFYVLANMPFKLYSQTVNTTQLI